MQRAHTHKQTDRLAQLCARSLTSPQTNEIVRPATTSTTTTTTHLQLQQQTTHIVSGALWGDRAIGQTTLAC